MVKEQIVSKISEKIGLTRVDSSRIVDTIFDEIAAVLKEGGRVELRGLGTFGTKLRAARVARNLKTNESINISERRVSFFKAGRELKNV